jgi:hypothetical protein
MGIIRMGTIGFIGFRPVGGVSSVFRNPQRENPAHFEQVGFLILEEAWMTS